MNKSSYAKQALRRHMTFMIAMGGFVKATDQRGWWWWWWWRENNYCGGGGGGGGKIIIGVLVEGK